MQRSFIGITSQTIRLFSAFAVLSIFIFLVIAALPPGTSATQESAQSDVSQKRSRTEFVPGEVLVRYRNEQLARLQTRQLPHVLLNADGRQFSVQIERFDGSDLVPGLRLARVAAGDTMAAIEALKAQPDVLYAEPNYVLHLDVTPNDPRFISNELYGLIKIGAPTAWNTTQGSSSVVVGVIDEGIDKNHPDLQSNIWVNPGEVAGNGVDDDGNGFVDDINGYNFSGNTETIPADNHATHVAGTIGAVGNNNVGVVGVNWQVRLMSLKFISGASGSTSDALRAANYAKLMHDLWLSTGGTKGANVRVLNNSYGGTEFSQSFFDAIVSLNQSGILFVAAAGNDDELNNDLIPHYPSSYDAPNVIGVAATDANDALAGFSHFGPASVHLGAPGVSILSTTANNTYSILNGTSMASPHVAGAAALLLAANPNLTLTQLKSLLIFNGDIVGSLSGKTITGRRLSVANSMQELSSNDVTPPGTPTNFHVNSQNGRALNVGWTASGDDGAAGQASLYDLSFTDANTAVNIPLKSLIPAASGVGQTVDVNLPYRHTSGTLTLREFDNWGNEGVPVTISVSVSLAAGDPYQTFLGSSVALSTGGTPLSLIGDDKIKAGYTLPFAFPFFGQNFSTVNITTNGNLFFSAPPTRSNGDADDVPSSAQGLTTFKMIAGLWDDLRTDSVDPLAPCTGCDVFVVNPDASRVIFRWVAVTYGAATVATQFPVNFEIELRSNGTILTRYGTNQSAPTNTNLLPVVGIGGGEPDAYVIPSHTSEQVFISLTNAPQVTFQPRSATPGVSLTVASSNPTSGVNVTVSPSDINGLGNGVTQFTRAYNVGTLVSLTAPATASGNNFLKWQRDGVDWATTPATSVTTDANHTMTAVYVIPATTRAITIASSNPSSGVSITVTPSDNGGFSSGTTQFIRTYNDGTVVNLTAPASVSGNNFLKWQRDGADWATTPATSVTMNANHTMTAVYFIPRTLTVASSAPDSGVSITVTPNDIGGLSSGTTQFNRTYNNGTVVNLTAPASAGGNPFLMWRRDGVDGPTTLATTVTMDANHTMTAVFNNRVQFTVPQFDVNEFEDPSVAADGAVTVTVSRAGSTAAPASVDYTTSDDVATQKGDYIFSAGRLNFAVGEASKSFKVLIVDDVYQEGTEKFKLVLSNPVGATLGVRSVADVAIFDNDPAAPTTNPLDNAGARFFVRQHYLDFLNREPDEAGLNYWIGDIATCGSNQGCITNKKVNVSAAFFLSIEFQETGYLVYRTYKAAFGDASGSAIINGVPTAVAVPVVRYGNFLPESAQIAAGVQVGIGNWTQQLEINKQAYMLAFVQRPTFQSAFSSSMTADQYVTQLNTRAGNVLSPAEKTSLINILGATPNDPSKRAQVLRAVAEDEDLKSLEKNRAFVLMQYFGYLRRNPNDLPDSDHSGWKFWLDKLEEHNGNFVNAQMVLAFLSSFEYRNRFGP